MSLMVQVAIHQRSQAGSRDKAGLEIRSSVKTKTPKICGTPRPVLPSAKGIPPRCHLPKCPVAYRPSRASAGHGGTANSCVAWNTLRPRCSGWPVANSERNIPLLTGKPIRDTGLRRRLALGDDVASPQVRSGILNLRPTAAADAVAELKERGVKL